MVRVIKVNYKKINLMDMVSINGQMEECIKGNGRKIKCVELGYLAGNKTQKEEKSMLDNLKIISDMGLEY